MYNQNGVIITYISSDTGDLITHVLRKFNPIQILCVCVFPLSPQSSNRIPVTKMQHHMLATRMEVQICVLCGTDTEIGRHTSHLRLATPTLGVRQ